MRWFVWILLLFCVQPVIGQQQMTASDRLRPQWMHRLPVPSNPSFVYIVEHAEGRTLEEAREGCLLRLAVGGHASLARSIHNSALLQGGLSLVRWVKKRMK